MSERAAFNEVGAQFLEYYETVRGHVRQELTRRYLLAEFPELSEPGLNIVDVGGGDGRDAVWLSELGHQVTVIDPAENMLARAAEQLDHTDADIAARITLQQSDVHSVRHTRVGQFDLALSHGVLMYLPDAAGHVHDLMDITKPAGKLSVLTRGYGATVQRLLADNDIEGVRYLQDNGVYVNHLDEDTWPQTPETLTRLLHKSGLYVQNWYGVRVTTDEVYTPLTALPAEDLQMILGQEAILGADPNTKGMGQMLHFLVCKIPPNQRKLNLNPNGYADYH